MRGANPPPGRAPPGPPVPPGRGEKLAPGARAGGTPGRALPGGGGIGRPDADIGRAPPGGGGIGRPVVDVGRDADGGPAAVRVGARPWGKVDAGRSVCVGNGRAATPEDARGASVERPLEMTRCSDSTGLAPGTLAGACGATAGTSATAETVGTTCATAAGATATGATATGVGATGVGATGVGATAAGAPVASSPAALATR